MPAYLRATMVAVICAFAALLLAAMGLTGASSVAACAGLAALFGISIMGAIES